MSAAGPSQTTVPAALDNIEVRQHLLEDGTILDIPAGILSSPPPKPAQFLYLKHYYQTPSGLKQELKDAGSVEAAVDILATELEGMRHLLTGYVSSLEKYVQKFDGEHEAVRKDLASIVDSYNGLRLIVKAVYEHAPVVDATLTAMEDKVRKIHKQSQIRAPPKITLRDGLNGQKKPQMTQEEANLLVERVGAHKTSENNSAWVANTQDMLKQRDQLVELIQPPSRTQPDVASAPAPAPAPAPTAADKKKKRADKGKGKGKAKEGAEPPVPSAAAPLDSRVELKIEKLADSLDAMREAFQRVHAKTEQDLFHLRVLSQKEKTATAEVWKAHDSTEYHALVAGKTTKQTARGIEAYDRWATKVLEDQEAQASQATEASQSTDATSASETSDPSTAPTTPPSTSQSTAADSEVYTVNLTLKFEKDLDELTREEAVGMLKALPLRILFTPFGAREDGAATAADGRPSEPQGAPQGASNLGDSEGAASEAGQPPAVAEKSKAGTESRRKRRRPTEDADETQVDARAAAGGEPVKKMRV